MSKLPVGLRDRWNNEVHGIRRSYGIEPYLIDFSWFVNEKTVLINNPIFSREAVQENLHIQRKNLKYKKIREFGTNSTKEIFMICPLCAGKHDLDEYK